MFCEIACVLLSIVLVIVAVSLAQTAAILRSAGLPTPGSEGKLDTIIQQGVAVAGELDLLRAEVAENKSAVDSAVLLLASLKAKLDEAIASGDMTQVAALAAELSGQTDALAAAIVANTSAQP